MALVNPYCSIAQVQDELRNTEATLAAADGQIELAINQVSRHIDNWKGRDYYQHDYTSTPLKIDYKDGSILVKDELWLPYTPVITLTSITVGDELWVVDEDFIVKSDRVISIDSN